MSDVTLNNITSGYNISKINDNFTTIEESINSDRLQTSNGGNTMHQQIDMDSNKIINLYGGSENTDGATYGQILDVRDYVEELVANLPSGLGWFEQNGVGAVQRTFQDKLRDSVSLQDFGGTPESASCDAALEAAIKANVKKIYLPRGTYTFGSVILNSDVELYGDGKQATIVNINGTGHGIVASGNDSLGNLSCVKIHGIQFNYTGTGQASTSHGLYVTRKVIIDDIIVNGFTNDGLYFDTVNTETSAPYFCHIANSWFTHNGRNGCWVRDNANANLFINCQFTNNGQYGFYHAVDGVSTYGSIIIGGQASYNVQEGYRLDSGTNLQLYGIYCEYNGNNAGGTPAGGYQNTPYDIYVGDNVTYTTLTIGTTVNNVLSHIRTNTNRSTVINYGGIPLKNFYTGSWAIDFGDDGHASFTLGPFTPGTGYSNGSGGYEVVFSSAGSMTAYSFRLPGNSAFAPKIYPASFGNPSISSAPSGTHVQGEQYWDSTKQALGIYTTSGWKYITPA